MEVIYQRQKLPKHHTIRVLHKKALIPRVNWRLVKYLPRSCLKKGNQVQVGQTAPSEYTYLSTSDPSKADQVPKFCFVC